MQSRKQEGELEMRDTLLDRPDLLLDPWYVGFGLCHVPNIEELRLSGRLATTRSCLGLGPGVVLKDWISHCWHPQLLERSQALLKFSDPLRFANGGEMPV